MTAAAAMDKRLRGAWVIGCVYLVLATLYGIIAPPFESPDEVGHFFAIKYIADSGKLPAPEKGPAQEYLYGQEGTQPPLYYLVGALLLRASRVSTTDAAGYLRVNPHTSCGSPQLVGNKGFLAHDPEHEAFPWCGTILALHLLRLYSTALGLATVLGVYWIALLCFPKEPLVGVLAAALTALNPQFLFVSGGINNDNLVVPLCTWAFYWLLRSHFQGLSLVKSIFVGVFIGLASLSKLTGVLLVPVAALMLILQVWREHRAADWRGGVLRLGREAALIAVPAIAIAGWWYLRNALLYRDPSLANHHLAIVSLRDATPLPLILREVPGMFHSFWGRFTCDITPGRWYTASWGLVTVAGLGGLMANWKRLDRAQRTALVWLGVWFLVVFGGWFSWNLEASGVQGRLLFPATASISVLVSAGLVHWIGRWKWPLLGLLAWWVVLALWVALGFIQPTFAPPPRFQNADQVVIQHPSTGVFGGRIGLLGYDLPERSVEPGDDLKVTLYLRALEPLTDTYSMGLWLVSAIPGDTTRLVGIDTWPGDGNYPTTAWRQSEVVEDSYGLAVPQDVPRAQAWLVQLNIYRMGDGQWLEYSRDGHPEGQRAILGWVRVKASVPLDVPAQAQLEQPVLFGGAIRLQGAQVVTNKHQSELHVTLWWESVTELGQDLTVFVHVVDASGNTVGNGDGPPLHGGFPSGMWQPGDGIQDEHVLPLPEDSVSGEYEVQVGWYDPDTGQRLPTGSGDLFVLPERICLTAD